jgi:hypothetical protein
MNLNTISLPLVGKANESKTHEDLSTYLLTMLYYLIGGRFRGDNLGGWRSHLLCPLVPTTSPFIHSIVNPIFITECS